MWGKLENRKVIPVSSTSAEFKDFILKEGTFSKRIGYWEEQGVFVSTVFMGLNHSFDLDRPLWFETMIFGGKHDQYQERYETLDEAEAGHKRAVKLAKRGFE